MFSNVCSLWFSGLFLCRHLDNPINYWPSLFLDVSVLSLFLQQRAEIFISTYVAHVISSPGSNGKW